MSKLKLVTQKEIEALKQLRDELKLQAHLFKAEAKDQWEKAESSWDHVMQDIGSARASIDRSSIEVSLAAQLLFESLRDSYRDIKQSIKR